MPLGSRRGSNRNRVRHPAVVTDGRIRAFRRCRPIRQPAPRQFALPLGQCRFAGTGTAALLLGAGAQLLFLAQARGQTPQIVGGPALPHRRQGGQSVAEVAQGREAAPSAAEIRPDRLEGRHPAVRRPIGHRPHVGLQQFGVRQFQREAVGQLFQPDQHILDADRRRQRADGLLHPVGQRPDLVGRHILRLEPQVGDLKTGQRGEGAGQ
ncbi:hypothetical protein [Azospirillum sp. BE72]|uniref:hypothetical protein n=1 Tax=Azospirillum sp. BE72 TaxID=2817776 RepID=UPI00286BCF9B|nr:hypothetical protein [Azospirillum sp. BE72]